MARYGPLEHPERAEPETTKSQSIAHMQGIPGFRSMGDPGLEPGNLFLIRKTFCRLQSSQLAVNPCKPWQQRWRKATGGDWSLQPGGPIVAPRPRFEGNASYDLGANIMPTMRSDPDASEAGRCAPAGSRRRPRPRCVVELVHPVTIRVDGGAGHCDRAGARHSPQRLPCRLDGIACLSPAGLRSNRGR